MQLALPLAPAAPRTDESEVEALCEWLRGRGWVSAQIIAANFRWSDRKIRALASASQGRIMSGQEGYKLTIEGHFDEVHRAAGWLISQGKDMIRRGISIRRRYHHGNT